MFLGLATNEMMIFFTPSRLRTLEFWVDNLNPQFLYPEMTKQTELFASLMQSLSRHLRPAPYPYGLLTLRLLGKLGGNNRQFLRDPLALMVQEHPEDVPTIRFACHWSEQSDHDIVLRIPLTRCLAVLETVACRTNERIHSQASVSAQPLPAAQDEALFLPKWEDTTEFLDRNLAIVDFAVYNNQVIEQTLEDQAKSCLLIVKKSVADGACNDGDKAGCEFNSSMRRDTIVLWCRCLLVTASIPCTAPDAFALLGELYLTNDKRSLHDGLVAFLSSRLSPAVTAEVGVTVVRAWLASDNREAERLLELLCNECCSADHVGGLRSAICAMTEELGPSRCRKTEMILINTAFVAVKSVPREISSEMVDSLRFFVRVCIDLYGQPGIVADESDHVLWDILSTETAETTSIAGTSAAPNENRPSDEVFRLLLAEIASPQQAMRYVCESERIVCFRTADNRALFVDTDMQPGSR